LNHLTLLLNELILVLNICSKGVKYLSQAVVHIDIELLVILNYNKLILVNINNKSLIN